MEEEIQAIRLKRGVGRMMNFRPIFTFALFLVAGVLYAYFRILEGKNAYLLLFAALLLPLVALCFARRKLRCAIYISIFYLAFALGNALFAWTVDDYRSQPKYAGEYTVEGTVVDKNYTDFGGEILLTNLTIDGNRQTDKMSVSVSEVDFGALQHCDRVRMRLTVRSVNVLDGRYGFRAEAVADRELYSGSLLTEYSVVGTDFKLGVFLRGALQTTIAQSMEAEGAALLTAILLGNTSGVEKGLLENIRYGGIAHIFAVSGLHIGFVATVLNYLFDKLRFKRIIKAFIIIAVLIFYSGVCGFSASSLRATIMSAILLFSAIGGDRYDKYVSVSTASLLVLMISPIQLFCVGFQLSFTVVTAMLLLTAPLSKMLKFLPRKVSSSLSAVLSAQVAGIPICLWAFNEFSLISILANLLFIPIVGVVFVALMVGVIVGGLFNICTVALFLQDKALYVINAIITAFDYRAFIVGGFTLGGFIIFEP